MMIIPLEHKTITTSQKDNYGEYDANLKGLTYGGLYFYFLNSFYIKNNPDVNTIKIPPVDAVVSINLVPYLTIDNIKGTVIPFDSSFFFPNKNINGNVMRLNEIINGSKTIGNATVYPTITTGGNYDWKKESKLWNYPYTYYEINDNISTPLIIEPHNYPTLSKTKEIKFSYKINALGMYTIFSPDYKGDSIGNIEGVVTQGLSLPSVSNAYSDYMVRNSNMFNHNKSWGYINNAKNVVESVATLNLGNILKTSSNSIFNAFENFGQNQSFVNDLGQNPNTLRGTGGDVLFNFQNSTQKCYNIRYQLNDHLMNIIGFKFHMYGYKQTKIMPINYKNRYYYNYVKLNTCNLQTTQDITKENLQTFKDIFLNGTTVWHITNNGVTVGDYSKDNYEV